MSRLFTMCLLSGCRPCGVCRRSWVHRSFPFIPVSILTCCRWRLVVVILGGTGSLLGSFVGSFVIGFLYNYGQALVSRTRLFRPVPADGDCAARCVRKACSAGCPYERTAHVSSHRADCMLAALPYWMPGSYYINIASQILFYAVFALAVDVLIGYGGLVSLGHAGILGVSCYIVAIVVAAGWGHFAAIMIAVAGTLIAMAVYALVALRATGIGFLMITLALGQIIWGLAYRWIHRDQRRQWIIGRVASGTVRLCADLGDGVLLCDADSLCYCAGSDCDFHTPRRLALR